ncbi:hypothetical protein BPAE_0057g00420 [Botrytis paeoniae]|uniref:Uncharacterized protein n=1 Tax=Botrytis paeoniae TaxID=278948 RepID=A0A4Z1FPF3_9HELO|nr:hypothetical protein BPAE_0057g00420 [Botrytis paeoniae]
MELQRLKSRQRRPIIQENMGFECLLVVSINKARYSVNVRLLSVKSLRSEERSEEEFGTSLFLTQGNIAIWRNVSCRFAEPERKFDLDWMAKSNRQQRSA